jgi:glutamine amidotransferase
MNIIPELIDRIYIRQVPFLGICVGMQILGSWGEEFEPCQGLGWVQGISRKIDVDTRDFPLPHVGWNTITVHHELPLFKRMDEDAAFYFVHSYHLACTDREVKQAFCHYGVPVLAALSKRNIHGVQFHPEKSQESGLKVLSNFISL